MALTSLNTIITSSCSREERGDDYFFIWECSFFWCGRQFLFWLLMKKCLLDFYVAGFWTGVIGLLIYFLCKNIAQNNFNSLERKKKLF